MRQSKTLVAKGLVGQNQQGNFSVAKPTSRSRRSPLKWKRRLRYLYLRLIRLRSSTKAIARGLATGVFAGFFPFFGLQTLIGVALAAIFRGNKLVAAAGTWVSNPLTYVPIYAFNFKIGQWLMGWQGITTDAVNWQSWSELAELGATFTICLLLGCTVVGLVAAVLTYFLGLWLVPRLRVSLRSSRRR